MRNFVFYFLLLASSVCVADDRTEKVRTLMEAQGLVKMFEQQMAEGKLEGQKQAQKMLDQLMSGLNPSKEFDKRLRLAFEEFMKALEPTWTAQDIVDVWAKAYGTHFTDQELDQLVEYYTSPLGKKDVMATQAALPDLTNHFSALSNPLLERATEKYVQRLQLIVKECTCNK